MQPPVEPLGDPDSGAYLDDGGLPERPVAGLLDRVQGVDPFLYEGDVKEVLGILVEAVVPGTSVGSMCEIHPGRGKDPVLAEVVGFKGARNLLMPLGQLHGVGLGSKVRPVRAEQSIPVGPELLGRVVGALGEPIDGKGPLQCRRRASIHRHAPDPLSRSRIRDTLTLGIRAVDGLLTLGKGQRIGILAGTGVGKSTILGMMARNSEADVHVIALIGERGREVREFIEEVLGEEGMAHSVVVAVTSDASPVLRVKGAFVAMTIAEHFRDQGLDVMLVMDSITRFAMAQREIGIAVGEPPTARGYTPSVFTMLPRLLERCGTQGDQGSITGIFAVLVEGEDFDDPIADATRGILDGHIVLTRKLATHNHFPAIDILQSTSRVMKDLVHPQQMEDAGLLRRLLSDYQEAEELVNIGAYRSGSNPAIDLALEMISPLRAFLRQGERENSSLEQTLQALVELALHAREGQP